MRAPLFLAISQTGTGAAVTFASLKSVSINSRIFLRLTDIVSLYVFDADCSLNELPLVYIQFRESFRAGGRGACRRADR